MNVTLFIYNTAVSIDKNLILWQAPMKFEPSNDKEKDHAFDPWRHDSAVGVL